MKLKRIIFTLFTLNFIFLSTPFAKALESQFSDVSPGDEHFVAIEYLTQHEVIKGYPEGHFGGDLTINRAELMTLMVRSLVGPVDSEVYHSCFVDVVQEWFAPYVCYAKQKGWISGYPDGYFRPSNEVLGSEAYKIILNPFFKAEIEAQTLEEIIKNLKGRTTDLNDWYAPYYTFARQKKLGFFNAENHVSRSEVAEFLFKTKLTNEQGWGSYDSYLRDEYLKKSNNQSLISNESKCYRFNRGLEFDFFDQYIAEKYSEHSSRKIYVNDSLYDQKITNQPSVYLSNVCALQDGSWKIIFSLFPGKNDEFSLHMLHIDSQEKVVDEQVHACSPFEFSFSILGHSLFDPISDPDSLELLDCSYAKDKNKVYTSDDDIKDADPATFVSLGFPYSKDNRSVFCRYNKSNTIDVKTIEVLKTTDFYEGESMSYAKDKNSVYSYCEVLEGLDPETLVVLSNEYLKDKNDAYYLEEPMQADPETFEFLGGEFAKDKNHAYFREDVVMDVDPNDFKHLKGYYATDGKTVYFMDVPLDGFHPDKFVTLDDQKYDEYINYATDGESIYYGYNKIQGADPSTFETLNNGYAKDKGNVYHYADITSFDAPSFEVLNSLYTKDKDKVYYKDSIIKGADANTFMLMDNDLAKDNRYLYKNDDPLIGLGLDVNTASAIDSSAVKDASGLYCLIYEAREKGDRTEVNCYPEDHFKL